MPIRIRAAAVAAGLAVLAGMTGAAAAQSRSSMTMISIGGIVVQAGDPEAKARRACGGNATSTQIYNRLGAPTGERITCTRHGKTHYIEISGGIVTAAWSQ